MSDQGPSKPMEANLFQAGSTCPFCQETVTEMQLIVECSACGSLQHETCWRHHGGCASYHCDKRVRVDTEELTAEVVITPGELAGVEPPAKPVRRTPQEATKPFLPPGPARLNRLALASLGVTGLGVIGDLEWLPSLSRISLDVNYRASTDLINEVLSLI